MRPDSRETRQARRNSSLSALQSPRWFAVGATVVGLLLRFWIQRFQAVGAERVPRTGGTFLIANHTSGLDPFLLGYPIRDLRPLGPGKTDIFANPVFAYVMRKIGIFPLRQGGADAGAVRAMVELYRAGRTVMVYPEGGRSRTGELMPFLPEFARLVVKMRARVVPAGIVGARDALPVGHYMPRRNVRVVVAYGEPFELDEYYGPKLGPGDAERAAEYLRVQVAAMIDVARGVPVSKWNNAVGDSSRNMQIVGQAVDDSCAPTLLLLAI
jgi:1-acyl-sn-glycerol-3-phosphate acyltransferase